MGHQALLDPLSKLVPDCAATFRGTRHGRGLVLRAQAIPLGPRPDPVRDRRQAPAPSRAAIVRNGVVHETVEDQHRHVVPARGARLDGHRLRLAYVSEVGDVKGTRDGRKRRDALRHVLVAREDTHEPAALGLTRGIDTARVDAVLRLELVEYGAGEADVVGSDLRDALPGLLQVETSAKSTKCGGVGEKESSLVERGAAGRN